MELMIASLILCFSLVAALQVYLNATSLIVESRNKTIATTHAKCILEEIRDVGVVGVSGRDWLSWLDGLQGVDLLPSEGVSINLDSPLNVPVTISWSEKSRSSGITLVGGFTQ